MAVDDYIDAANEALDDAYEAPQTIREYVDTLFERPSVGAHAARYLLDAIEHAGTREVYEEGEEKERYRFFDDPWNDGEHAILGNTDVLNQFVDDIRTIASGRGKDEKIVWVVGPTGTGKSELKRCLVSGLREYSKTEAGRRYTLEWNISSLTDSEPTLTYGGETPSADEDDWYRSPVQTHPLSVFPSDVRNDILTDVNNSTDAGIDIHVDTDLDPFSREAYTTLEEAYQREGADDLFSAITDSKHCRVTNYVVDEGNGIGVLHAEDDGSAKERLVGSWMPEMFSETESRGRKNAQAFAYDGVLSQGNNGLTIVEDAGQHAELLTKLLNVPDEEHVKLDKGIGMDIDTQLVVISNHDLDAELSKYETAEVDKLNAIKRRLEKRQMQYLTNVTLEAQLLRRELTDETTVWTSTDYDDLEAKMQEPVHVTVSTDDKPAVEKELAPHTIEGAAMFTIVSRMDPSNTPTKVLNYPKKALLYDRGSVDVDGDEVTVDDFDMDPASDGTGGIPVTYTRDVLADLLHQGPDRSHNDVILPRDVINEMEARLDSTPLFSAGEVNLYSEHVDEVRAYIYEQQEQDVLDAILADQKLDDATIREYLEHVYADATGDTVDTPRGEEEPSKLVMKVFETEHLGMFDESDYNDDNTPTKDVTTFRDEQIFSPLKSAVWENRSDDFTLDDVDIWDIPAIHDELHDYGWDDVQRLFEDFDPWQWDDPPSETETATVKDKAIQQMVDAGYSETSAELTSQRVFEQVVQLWD